MRVMLSKGSSVTSRKPEVPLLIRTLPVLNPGSKADFVFVMDAGIKERSEAREWTQRCISLVKLLTPLVCQCRSHAAK